MKTQYLFFTLIVGLSVTSCNKVVVPKIEGELKKWHRTTLIFEGPNTSELAEDNPFLNYRLDITFSNNGSSYTVPGFYAADGNAAETSADAGNIWKVHFTPDKVGEWNYQVSFKKGSGVAIASDLDNAASGEFMDGYTGSFSIGDTDKTGDDNRAKGRLNYVGESYLKFAETDEYFIKLGVDAPENLLAYDNFDAGHQCIRLPKTMGTTRQRFFRGRSRIFMAG